MRVRFGSCVYTRIIIYNYRVSREARKEGRMGGCENSLKLARRHVYFIRACMAVLVKFNYYLSKKTSIIILYDNDYRYNVLVYYYIYM